MRFPLDIVEMIISYFIYDTPSLLACSLTCSTWYTVVVPRLHQTLTILMTRWPKKKFVWPKPLRHMHKLGLLPLVKNLQVRGGYFPDRCKFAPKLLDCRTIHHFLALVNVQELELDRLDIHKFMPRVRRYFKNFLPTVQSLALREPQGSRPEIIYFVGLFQHLEDLKLCYQPCNPGPADDLALIPLFAPPLRGRLTMASVSSVDLLTDMVHLFGGIRFHYMDLFNVEGVWIWIDACAETLETLRLYPTGEQASLKRVRVLAHNFAARSALLRIDLSRHKSLRTLEVPASCVYGAFRYESPDISSRLLKHVLLTITSPAFSEVVVVYRDYDFCGVEAPDYPTYPPVRGTSQADRAMETLQHHTQFGVFRDLHKVREFRLVLCAGVWGCVGDYSVRVLEEAVAVEKAERGFGERFPEPLVIYKPLARRTNMNQDLYAFPHPSPQWPDKLASRGSSCL